MQPRWLIEAAKRKPDIVIDRVKGGCLPCPWDEKPHLGGPAEKNVGRLGRRQSPRRTRSSRRLRQTVIIAVAMVAAVVIALW